jgi:hypothetical protein
MRVSFGYVFFFSSFLVGWLVGWFLKKADEKIE